MIVLFNLKVVQYPNTNEKNEQLLNTEDSPYEDAPPWAWNYTVWF